MVRLRISTLQRRIIEAHAPHVCKICGGIFVPDYATIDMNGPFVDPFEMQRRRVQCMPCINKESK